MNEKLLTYIRRYGIAEITGTITAVIAAWIGWSITGNKIVAAIAGTWGENIGFYGIIISGDIIHARRLANGLSGKLILKVLRNILIEFGIAELFDSLFLRPAMLYLGTLLIHDIKLGTLAGKLGADILFYLLAIISRRFIDK